MKLDAGQLVAGKTSEELLDMLKTPDLWQPAVLIAARSELQKREVGFNAPISRGEAEVIAYGTPLRCDRCGETEVCSPARFMVGVYDSHLAIGVPGGTLHKHHYKLLSAESINLCNSCRKVGYLHALGRTLGSFFLPSLSVLLFELYAVQQDPHSFVYTLSVILGIPAIGAFLVAGASFYQLLGDALAVDNTVEQFAALSREGELKLRYGATKLYKGDHFFLGIGARKEGQLCLFTRAGWDSLKDH